MSMMSRATDLFDDRAKAGNGVIVRRARHGRYQVVFVERDAGEDVELFVLGLRGWRFMGSAMACAGGCVWWGYAPYSPAGLRGLGVGVAFFTADDQAVPLMTDDGVKRLKSPSARRGPVVSIDWRARSDRQPQTSCRAFF